MKPELTPYYIMTCDPGLTDDAIRDAWVSYRRKVLASSERAAIELAYVALDGGDDGDEIAVVVATQEDGRDAKRCVVTLRVSYDYDYDPPKPVNMTEPVVDSATGEPVKGLQDDATLPLFG